MMVNYNIIRSLHTILYQLLSIPGPVGMKYFRTGFFVHIKPAGFPHTMLIQYQDTPRMFHLSN